MGYDIASVLHRFFYRFKRFMRRKHQTIRIINQRISGNPRLWLICLGKELYDVLEGYARKGYYAIDPKEKKKGQDILWFIWENQNSPVFGKAKMTTFERYFIADKKTHQEPKNPYYRLLEKEEVVNRILEEFGLEGAEAHIINGHIPVEAKKGESPVKCKDRKSVV